MQFSDKYRLYAVRRCNPFEIAYQVHPYCKAPTKSDDRVLSDLLHFFRLDSDVSLASLHSSWSEQDQVFKRRVPYPVGVRVLRVNPLEALMSFICSSNNNITRITHMVQSLCSTMGQLIATDDKEDESYYKFPTVDALCREDCESLLSSLGFGYRAKYIWKCAEKLSTRGGESWLQSLRAQSYEGNRPWLVVMDTPLGKVWSCAKGHLFVITASCSNLAK